MDRSFRDLLMDAIGQTGRTLRSIHTDTGVSYDTLKNLKQGKSQSTNPRDAQQIASAFGVTLDEFMAGNFGAAPSQMAVRQADPDLVLVPVYDIAASAGPGTYVDYEMQVEALSLPRDYLRSLTSTGLDQLAIIRVKGDSMEPTLRDGDIVLVDLAKNLPGFDGLFVIELDGALHVKRLARSGKPGVIRVLSDNPLYPPAEYAEGGYRIIGKVRWRGGRMG